MTRGGRPVRGYLEKMHPLFGELYLGGDVDDPDEAQEEWRTERAQARARRKVLEKRTHRRA
jgi:hypothetical protein